MPRSRSTSPDPSNQERGYKAAIHNPTVSNTAKQHAKRMLEEKFGVRDVDGGGGGEGGEQYVSENEYDEAKNPVQSSRGGTRPKSNVVRGLKAAIHNPNNTDVGRRQAAEKMRDLGETPPEEPQD